jgi:hypothetical protein
MILQTIFLVCLSSSVTTAFSPWTAITSTTTTSTTTKTRTSRFLQASSQQDIDDLVFDQHTPQSLPEFEYTPILISDKSLVPIATQLRNRYDEHFQDPRQPNENRFIWDPWFVLVGDGKTQQQQQQQDSNQEETTTSSSSSMEDDDDDDTAVLLPGEAEATRQQIQYSLKETNGPGDSIVESQF